MSNRDEIIDSFTRTLFVEAYASLVEEMRADGEDTDDMPQAHGGDDWMDEAPVTPDWVTPVAMVKLAAIEAYVGESVESLYDRASAYCAGQPTKCQRRTHTPEAFGSDLAMQYVGHGVSWSDDHAMRLDLPHGDSIDLSSRTDCGLPEVEESAGSGYTACPCCGYDTISNDMNKPELCLDCEEAKCEADGSEPCLCTEEGE